MHVAVVSVHISPVEHTGHVAVTTGSHSTQRLKMFFDRISDGPSVSPLVLPVTIVPKRL